MAHLTRDVVRTQIDTSGFGCSYYELWRAHDMWRRYRELCPHLWDVMLYTIDGKVIRSSRKDLSAISPVFARMFACDLKEAHTGTVHLEWSSTTVEKFLEACYGHEVGQLTAGFPPSASPSRLPPPDTPLAGISLSVDLESKRKPTDFPKLLTER
jgi:hypothetical protein